MADQLILRVLDLSRRFLGPVGLRNHAFRRSPGICRVEMDLHPGGCVPDDGLLPFDSLTSP